MFIFIYLFIHLLKFSLPSLYGGGRYIVQDRFWFVAINSAENWEISNLNHLSRSKKKEDIWECSLLLLITFCSFGNLYKKMQTGKHYTKLKRKKSKHISWFKQLLLSIDWAIGGGASNECIESSDIETIFTQSTVCCISTLKRLHLSYFIRISFVLFCCCSCESARGFEW